MLDTEEMSVLFDPGHTFDSPIWTDESDSQSVTFSQTPDCLAMSATLSNGRRPCGSAEAQRPVKFKGAQSQLTMETALILAYDVVHSA